jgi:uncharacterized protein with ParB-like and HNH nuclease domain/predicted transport protein
MKAEDVRLTQLLEGPKQFIVPVFQRDYSWGTKHCLQLWNDIIRIGSDEKAKAHFVGSIVYIAAEDNNASITRWLLIDGQQRLTTLTILLTAFRNRIQPNKHQDSEENGLPTREELEDYYLRNIHGKVDRRYKLQLRRGDQDSLQAILEGKKLSENGTDNIRENFEFFEEQLDNADLEIVHRGIKKLVAVDVSLTRGQDDPQMIFESLNSTGLDLTQADLIRNFVLMRQDETTQTKLYKDYWQPVEIGFGKKYRSDFDKFMRDYLTLQLRPSKQLKADQIYHQFRNYYYQISNNSPIENTLEDIKRFSEYYVAFSFGKEGNARLRDSFRRLRGLAEVTSPLLLKLYDLYSQAKTLSVEEFVEAVELLESYVFRRSVCDMQTRSLGQIFSNLSYRINSTSPLLSLKVALYRQGKKRRFPSDTEFREALETRDIYDMRNCLYLLDRLENDSKEKIDTTNFTIEHVLPQNEELISEWKKMLGQNWKKIQEVWLHRLGNITLTAYNSRYSDRSFIDKKSIEDGFNVSPLRLNMFIKEQNQWTEKEIEARGKQLAKKALKIWRPLEVEIGAVQDAELEDRKAQAARYSIENLEFEPYSRNLFDLLRPKILELGDDVIELFTAKSITYRVYDFFLEIIPRRKRLTLNLNLDFEECDDPSQHAADADDFAFIIYATENGGVLFGLREESQINAAVHIIRQAYDKISN